MEGPETRQSLLLRLKDATQQDAWQEFVDIYEPLVYRLARKRGLQHADASDISQEVFSAVRRAIHRFDLERSGSFRGWLFRIARNLVLNFLTRQREPRGSGDSSIQAMLEQKASPDEATTTLFQTEYRRELFRHVASRIQDQFQDDTWRAFWLTGVEGESIESVAELLGKSPGAIRVARCRVLAKLKREVARLEQESQ